MRIFYCFLLLAFLSGCHETPEKPPIQRHTIFGRSDQALSTREPIYRIQVPENWQVLPSDLLDPLTDTKKALLELELCDEDEKLRLTFHNFPTDLQSEEVPHAAQIARWQAQMKPLYEKVRPQSFSGFYGLLYEAENEQNTLMAWAMSLDPGHYQNLLPSGNEDAAKQKQRRASWTFKAIGQKQAFIKHREDIYQMARSLELIDEVPNER